MGTQVSITSAALRVTLYFARNPDEELTSSDITHKFGIEPNDVHQRLSRAVRDGMLAKRATGPGRGRQAVYTAGHHLLVMIGERRVALVEACMPVVGCAVTVVGV